MSENMTQLVGRNSKAKFRSRWDHYSVLHMYLETQFAKFCDFSFVIMKMWHFVTVCIIWVIISLPGCHYKGERGRTRELCSGGSMRTLLEGITDERKQSATAHHSMLFHPILFYSYIFWACDTPDIYAMHCNSPFVCISNRVRFPHATHRMFRTS